VIEPLLLIAIILGILSLEEENMLHAISFLGLLGLCLAIMYYLMGAGLIALFQASIAASSIMILGYLIFSMSREGKK
jgi:uncharacterized MnhB-related membrane protein